jgi:hypothetical protein
LAGRYDDDDDNCSTYCYYHWTGGAIAGISIACVTVGIVLSACVVAVRSHAVAVGAVIPCIAPIAAAAVQNSRIPKCRTGNCSAHPDRPATTNRRKGWPLTTFQHSHIPDKDIRHCRDFPDRDIGLKDSRLVLSCPDTRRLGIRGSSICHPDIYQQDMVSLSPRD